MPFGPRPACAFGPADLAVPHSLKCHGWHDVVDDVPRKDDAIAGLLNKIANDEVIRKIVRCYAVVADFRNGILAGDDRRPKAEFHAFQKICRDYARSHLNGHSDRVHRRPEAACILTAVNAGEHTNGCVKHWRYNLRKIVRRHFYVAVTRYENVVG